MVGQYTKELNYLMSDNERKQMAYVNTAIKKFMNQSSEDPLANKSKKKSSKTVPNASKLKRPGSKERTD